MSGKSILIVDDVKENLDILIEILSPLYSVKPALNGKAALKIAEKTQPDLILLDIIMPEMDGFQVLNSLKSGELTKNIPVVFISSADDETERKKGLEAGAVEYLIKPVDSRKLISFCNEFLDK